MKYRCYQAVASWPPAYGSRTQQLILTAWRAGRHKISLIQMVQCLTNEVNCAEIFSGVPEVSVLTN